jgi:DNA-binding IclR family transcriptional regulator
MMPSETKPESGGTAGAQAIRRAIDVIRAVAQLQRSGATLSKVAHATALNASTAFRILRSLTEERMLSYDESERHYYLGPLAFELGLATHGKSHILDQWRATVSHIAQRTRLTTYLMARSENEAVCLLCEQGSTLVRAMPMEVGQRLPLGIGAGSLAILATLGDGEVDRILATNTGRLNLYPGGKDKTSQIRERVAEARKNGFAVSSNTVANGLTGIGVPIQPTTGLLQLAISVSAAVPAINAIETKQYAAMISTAIAQRKSNDIGNFDRLLSA